MQHAPILSTKITKGTAEQISTIHPVKFRGITQFAQLNSGLSGILISPQQEIINQKLTVNYKKNKSL